jgi:hypothetical protein
MHLKRRFILLWAIVASLILGLPACIAVGSPSSTGVVHVNGYYRSNGTYVAPYYRTAPNSTKADNWSTIGNTNPYTGAPGTKSGDLTPAAVSSEGAGVIVSGELQPGQAVLPSSAENIGQARVNLPGAPLAALSEASLNALAVPALLDEITSLKMRIEVLENQVRTLSTKQVTPQSLPVTLTEWRRIKGQMSPEQVKEILGEPVRIADWQWHYPNGGRITFIDERVWQWAEPTSF